MADQLPTPWRNTDAGRRALVRRLLLAGALSGLAAGLVAQTAVDTDVHGGELEWLIRLALILPAVIFVAWWLLFPGITLEQPDVPMPEPIDASERLEKIEATFDDTAVPRARRARLENTLDGDAHDTYRDSISRDAVAPDVPTPQSFGIRRPAGRDVDAV